MDDQRRHHGRRQHDDRHDCLRRSDAGETVVGTRYVQGFGGKGANQAVMASRLGADVSMVNQVGRDALGDMTIENLAGEGIDVALVGRIDGVSTGVAPIWVQPDGTNRIIVVPGANDHLTPAQARQAVEGAPALHLVLGQFEVPQAVTAAAFEAARARGALTVLNPAPAADVSPDLLAVTDWLIPNEVEFAHLARSVGVAGAEADDETMVAVSGSTRVSLAVTLGAQGAVVCNRDGRVTRVTSPAVKAMDTTGAGDAFVGAFAYGLARGWAPETSADLGCRCAALSVTRAGTQSSFPSATEAGHVRDQVGNRATRRHRSDT